MTLVVTLVVTTVVVAVVAAWPMTPWQALLLAAVPVAVVAAVLGVPIIRSAGWLVTLLGPYALLTVLPVLPWRRGWARWAVPLSVALVVLALVLVTRASPAVLFLLVPPCTTVLLGLRRGLARHRSTSPSDLDTTTPSTKE